MNARMSTGTRSVKSSSTSQGTRDGASQAEAKRERVKHWIFEELETVSAVTINPYRNGTQNNVRSGARNGTRVVFPRKFGCESSQWYRQAFATNSVT